MKIQVWFCNLCEEEFAVSDIPRDTVRCTGGHLGDRSARLTADHWPLEAEYRRTEGLTVPKEKPEKWDELVLEEGKRFGLGDAKKGPDAAQERATRLSGYGWPGEGA